MSTEFAESVSAESIMADSAAPVEAPVSSTETSTAQVDNVSTQVDATVTTPEVAPQQPEGVGIANLRAQYKKLEADANTYKGSHEFVEKLGGMEKASELVPQAMNVFSAIIAQGENFRPYNVAKAISDADPDNFHALAMAMPTMYPPLAEAMREQILAELQASGDLQQRAPQDNGGDSDYEYDETDPLQARLKTLEEENRGYKTRFDSIEKSQQETAQEQIDRVANERVNTHVVSKLLPLIKTPLAELKGWPEPDVKRLERDIRSALDDNQQYNELMERAVDYAKKGKTAALLEILPDIKKHINGQVKESTEFYSRKLGFKAKVAQDTRAAQEARREIPTGGTAAAPTTQHKGSRLYDPSFDAEITADIERQFAGRGQRRI